MSRFPCSLISTTILYISLALGAVLSHRDIQDHGRAAGLESRQAPGVISTQNFVRRAWHASAVAGNYLYIEGGEFSYKTGNFITYQYSSATLSIDLSQDWRNDSVLLHTTSKPQGAPVLSSPAFAYDEQNDIFYSGFAGRVSDFGDAPQPPPMSLWSFKPDGTGGGTWKREIGNSDPAFDHLTRPVRGYQAYGRDAALSLGGVSTYQTSPTTEQVEDDIPLAGLLGLNMTTKTFTNSSAKSFNAGQNGVLGQMHYVPSFGPNGFFAIMGGTTVPDDTDSYIGFGNIWVYEPVTNIWYNQTATGNIPQKRKEFCTAGLNSTSGTYEIFLYGGEKGNLGPDAVPFDEIFILTLPAFRWLKVDYPPQHPRLGHTCNAVGGSQVMSIGGIDANPNIYVNAFFDDIRKSTFNTSVDPFAQGLGIFDMTTLTWADHYTANAPPYEQSDLVKKFYADNPQNGSQFTTPGLQSLFQTTHFSQTTPAASGPSPTPSLGSSSSSSGTSTGAIAGGVVGGVVGLALLAGLAYFFYRRRRQGYSKQGQGGSMPELQSNRHPAQEIDGSNATGYYGGVKANEYHELSQQQKPAEVAGTEARQEMGHDEVKGTGGRPFEMEAREARR